MFIDKKNLDNTNLLLKYSKFHNLYRYSFRLYFQNNQNNSESNTKITRPSYPMITIKMLEMQFNLYGYFYFIDILHALLLKPIPRYK